MRLPVPHLAHATCGLQPDHMASGLARSVAKESCEDSQNFREQPGRPDSSCTECSAVRAPTFLYHVSYTRLFELCLRTGNEEHNHAKTQESTSSKSVGATQVRAAIASGRQSG